MGIIGCRATIKKDLISDIFKYPIRLFIKYNYFLFKLAVKAKSDWNFQ